MNANSASLVILCAVACAALVIGTFLRERLSASDSGHSIISFSRSLVKPSSWDNGSEGVGEDGVPYYEAIKDDVSEDVAATPAAAGRKKEKVLVYGHSGNSAA